MWLVDRAGFGRDTYRVDNSYLILNDYFDLPVHQEGEVLVHYEDCVKAVEAIHTLVVTERIPVNYITEVTNLSLLYCIFSGITFSDIKVQLLIKLNPQ